MKAGYYLTNDFKPKKFWLIGVLPDGDYLTLHTRNDGTSYYDKCDIHEAKYWKEAGK